MAMEFDLIPKDSLVKENGYGAPVDVRASQTRTFYCVLYISDQIEQESVDVSIWGSADGENWARTHTEIASAILSRRDSRCFGSYACSGN